MNVWGNFDSPSTTWHSKGAWGTRVFGDPVSAAACAGQPLNRPAGAPVRHSLRVRSQSRIGPARRRRGRRGAARHSRSRPGDSDRHRGCAARPAWHPAGQCGRAAARHPVSPITVSVAA
eukprot:692555-Hanusia_phi.AAC.1